MNEDLSNFQAAAFACTVAALHALLIRQAPFPVNPKDAPKEAAIIGLETAKQMLSQGIIKQ